MTTFSTSGQQPEMLQRLRQIRHFALDMDGTIYKGNMVFEATRPFLQLLGDLQIGHTFLTNNPSKSADGYLKHLAGMDIPANRDQLCTSAHAAMDFLSRERSEIRRLFVLGTSQLKDELTGGGFAVVSDEPDAVLISFDTTLTYERLCQAAWWIKQGKPYFATNPDLVCPTDLPTVLIDCGSIAAALEKATGRAPDVVFGKPDPSMLENILHRHSLKPEALAMVGDRLYTDIVMARRAGTLAILVLTGEATASEAKAAELAPDLVVPSLMELSGLLRQAFSSAA